MSIKIAVAALIVAIATGLIVERVFTKSRVTTISRAGGLEAKVVSLEGRIHPLGDNRFVLSDSTGKVEIETCPVWYKRIELRPGETVIVIGERMYTRPRVKGAAFLLSAFSIEGTRSGTITIRDHLGKPPWAFSRNPNSAGN